MAFSHHRVISFSNVSTFANTHNELHSFQWLAHSLTRSFALYACSSNDVLCALAHTLTRSMCSVRWMFALAFVLDNMHPGLGYSWTQTHTHTNAHRKSILNFNPHGCCLCLCKFLANTTICYHLNSISDFLPWSKTVQLHLFF